MILQLYHFFGEQPQPPPNFLIKTNTTITAIIIPIHIIFRLLFLIIQISAKIEMAGLRYILTFFYFSAPGK